MNYYSYQRGTLKISNEYMDYPLVIKSSIFFLFLTLFGVFESWIFLAIASILYIVLTFIIFIRRRMLYLNSYLLWGIVFLLYSITSLLWSESITSSFYGIRSVLQFILIGGTIIWNTNTLKQYTIFIKSIVWAGFLLVLKIVLTIPISQLRLRNFGDLNANEIAISLCISIISVQLLVRLLNGRKAYNLLIFSYVSVIILTASRKGILLAFLCLSLNLILGKRRIGKRIKTIFTIIFIIVITIPFMQSNEILNVFIWKRFEGLFNAFFNPVGYVDASTRSRFNLISIGIDLWKDSPIIGHGIGTYTAISGEDVYAHNNFIELGVNLGIIGLVIYYSIYLVIGSRLFPKYKIYPNNYFLVLLIVIIIFDYGWVSLVSDLLQIFLVLLYLWPQVYRNGRILR